MKYFIIKSLPALLFICFIACDVERIPETQITDESFWNSETELKEATNYLYTFLPDFPNQLPMEEVWSDNVYGGEPNDVSDGSRLAPATSTYYSDPYKLIRAANRIVENAPKANVLETVRNTYIAEALFFRAFAYVQLVQKYGGVPLILKTLDETSPELTQAASSRQEVMSQIYSDLDFAISNLPMPSKLGATNYGRATKTAALALKARIALFEGTRAKFHNDGNGQEHLTLALNSAKTIIDSKEHSLYSNYFNLFQYAGEGPANKENIFVRKYGISTANVISSHLFPERIANGWITPTKSLVDSYLMKDGLPIAKSPLYVVPDSTTWIFKNRDGRLHATIFKRGDSYTVGTKYTPSLERHKTGFAPKKYFNAEDLVSRKCMIDWVLIRYAEVLLTYAEAKYELNGSISDADLDISINLLRTRGGVAKLSNSFVSTNGLNMREEIRRERRVELAIENLRYWDLIRWKIAETELPKALLGSYYFKNEFGTSFPAKLDANGYIVVQDASYRKFNPAKDYLWPFPVNEIALNPALIQNPGWEGDGN